MANNEYVYILSCGVDYEGCNIVGVFTSKSELEKSKRKLLKEVSMYEDYIKIERIKVGVYDIGLENKDISIYADDYIRLSKRVI